MNIVRKLIRKEEYELSYVSFDGEVFDCSQDCITHEAIYRKQAVEPCLIKNVKTFDGEHDATAFYINSLQEFLAMKKYILAMHRDCMNYLDIEPWEYSGADWYIYYMCSSCDNKYDDYVFTRFQSESNELSNKFQDFIEQFEDLSQ